MFDSQLTTYTVLDELTARGIRWLTPCANGRTELARLAALPASAHGNAPPSTDPAATAARTCTKT